MSRNRMIVLTILLVVIGVFFVKTPFLFLWILCSPYGWLGIALLFLILRVPIKSKVRRQ